MARVVAEFWVVGSPECGAVAVSWWGVQRQNSVMLKGWKHWESGEWRGTWQNPMSLQTFSPGAKCRADILGNGATASKHHC